MFKKICLAIVAIIAAITCGLFFYENFFAPVVLKEDPVITEENGEAVFKPVIYLYSQQESDVRVELDYKGDLFCTYPEYNGKWEVTAKPDGTLINKADGQEYSYLFWEGYYDYDFDMSEGYVVAGKDTAAFLQKTLSGMGLTPKEYNEFIVYWLPQMQDNPYNLITFQKDVYTKSAPLTIDPVPDSMLRVFMAYKSLEQPVNIPEPAFEPFERKGFTVIEWGGTEIVD